MIQSIEDLIFYELNHHVIEQRDVVYVRNQLYRLLSLDLTEPLPEPKDILYPAIAIETILNDLELKGLLDGSKVSRDLLDTKLMTVFTSKPSEVESHFFKLYKQDKQSATNWYYDYVHHINYIRTERIMKNQSFITPSKYGNLEITINLSKPEKDPKSIALSASAKSSEFPKCLLCVENEGFAGNFSRDARDNHRMIGFDLNGSNYYFQYSPYIYYNEHAIILNALHKPMKIDGQTFDNLLTLCDTFEGYFFGSNADLPIVGGSILSHDHYQGGKHVFPIEKASFHHKWTKDNLTYYLLNWPLSTIRIQSKDKISLINKAVDVLQKWQLYTNPSLSIYNHSDGTPHQTITPIVRKINTMYEMDLILRNNFTNEDYPLGVFHPHADKWHIKKENIGLIEAMGLAVLPARLEQEFQAIKKHILNHSPLSADLVKHQPWIDHLKKLSPTKDSIDDIIRHATGEVFMQVLEDCGVFKMNKLGISTFKRFIEEEIL